MPPSCIETCLTFADLPLTALSCKSTCAHMVEAHRAGIAVEEGAGARVVALRVAALAHQHARNRPQDALQPCQQRRQRVILRSPNTAAASPYA